MTETERQRKLMAKLKEKNAVKRKQRIIKLIRNIFKWSMVVLLILLSLLFLLLVCEDQVRNVSVLTRIARFRLDQKNYEKALHHYKTIYEVQRMDYGEDHTLSIEALHQVARVQLERRKYDDAFSLFFQVYDMRVKNDLLDDLNETDAVSSMQKAVLDIFREDEEKIVLALNGLADSAEARGDLKTAIKLLEVIEEKRQKQIFGEDEPDLVHNLMKLSDIHRDLEELQDMEKYNNEIYGLYDKHKNKDNIKIIHIINNVYNQTKNWRQTLRAMYENHTVWVFDVHNLKPEGKDPRLSHFDMEEEEENKVFQQQIMIEKKLTKQNEEREKHEWTKIEL